MEVMLTKLPLMVLLLVMLPKLSLKVLLLMVNQTEEFKKNSIIQLNIGWHASVMLSVSVTFGDSHIWCTQWVVLLS
jgi:hypothetical protein